MPRTVVPRSHPIANIKLVALDYQTGNVSIVTTDGRIHIDRITAPKQAGLVTRSTFIPAESRVEIVAAGEVIGMALGTVRTAVSVPVVYLDQNHWIDFARWRKSPETFDVLKRPFFDALARAVVANRVIVPLSSAHLTETSKRGGSTRLELAATMLQYSRGWQFRTVLGLRRAELRALFGGSRVTKDDAITLAPQAILDMKPDRSMFEDLGPELAGLVQRQVWASVLVSLLLDDKPDRDHGRESSTRWAESFAPLAESLRSNTKAKAWSRDLTRTRFISDLGTDLPAAAKERGISPDQFSDWLRREAEDAISGSAGLSRLREVLHLRLMNADDRWESSDLNDWMYLSYAAGYCDLILGERKTSNYLRRANPRVPPGATLHRRSSEALVDLLRLTDVDRPND